MKFRTIFFIILVSIIAILTAREFASAEGIESKTWNFEDGTVQGWSWYTFGTSASLVSFNCDTSYCLFHQRVGKTPGGTAFYITDSWSNLLGIDSDERVARIMSDSSFRAKTLLTFAPSDYTWYIGSADLEDLYCTLKQKVTFQGTYDWTTIQADDYINGCLHGHDRGSDIVTIAIIANLNNFQTGQTSRGYLDDITLKFFTTRDHEIWQIRPLIPIAYASTTCNFDLYGASTTAVCSDPIIQNTTQDIGTGLFLFFVTFFGILFYFRKV